MNSQILFLLGLGVLALVVVWQIAAPKLPINFRRIGRAMSNIGSRLHYPVALLVFLSLATNQAPDALAPLLYSTGGEICLGWVEFSTWESVIRWGTALLVVPVTRFAYEQYQHISDLRRNHLFIYSRFSEIVTSPGNWTSDLIWAYAQAILVFMTSFSMVCGAYLAIALFLECHPILILIVYLILAALPLAAWQLSLSIITESMKPRRLEAEVRQAGQIVPELEKRLDKFHQLQQEEQRPTDEEVRRDAW